jgi:soluble lytic murein transglycosylase
MNAIALALLVAQAETAGALMGAGRLDEAVAVARACEPPACRLVAARASFMLGQFDAAAEAAAAGRLGSVELAAYAAKLQGESLLLAGRPAEAVEPLRAAAVADPDGPAGLRASALLADALLAAGDAKAALDQATRALGLSGQPGEIRAGMALVRAEALAAAAESPAVALEAAKAWRAFWLEHPDHPAAATARAEEARLSDRAGEPLPDPEGRDLLRRAQRLLSAGQPGSAVAQAEAASNVLRGEDLAEAQLAVARSLAADGRRSDAAPALTTAWKRGSPHVAASAGLLLARDRTRRGMSADAIRILDSVARKYPHEPEADESAYVAARLLLEAGDATKARRRLLKIAGQRNGAHASDARWTLAWLAYRGGSDDAADRFASFASGADSDDTRAQGVYWQARTTEADEANELYRRVVELDPFGWYGVLARQKLGTARGGAPAFPPAIPVTDGAATLPDRLRIAEQLYRIGFYAEAGAEADRFVQQHPGHSGEPALAVYEQARRYDRALQLADALLGGRYRPDAPRMLLSAVFPIAYPDQVAPSSARTGLDPYFVLAVMRRESLFRPDTRSAAGAVGLLQLLPATARRASIVLGRPPPGDAEMAEPRVAIDLGAWYLAELLGRFGDPVIAAAAYNAGPRIAGPWAQRAAGQPLDEWVEEIPYRETRRYVKVVIGAWGAYRILAGGEAPALSDVVPAPKDGAAF